MRIRTGIFLTSAFVIASCGSPSGDLRSPGPFIYYPSVWDTPLHQAAEGSLPATVRAKIGEVGDVDVRGKGGATPLMLAAGSSSRTNENIRLLIQEGADVNAHDERGWTPLMYATNSWWHHQHGSMRQPEDSLERIRILLDAGADIHARADQGETVLMIAAECDTFATLPKGAACTLLIKRGAQLEARDSHGLTPLMYAARCNSTNVTALLRAGADINATDPEGRTALMIAFADKWCAGDTVTALLKGKPNLELVDKDGWTALCHAVWHGRMHSQIAAILDAGARIEPLGWKPLHAAAVCRDSRRVKRLLAAGADPNARDKWGRTPLMWAVRTMDFCDRQTIPALVGAGAEVNAADENGATALHIAASHAWREETDDLVANGAQIDARDTDGKTPLMYAAACQYGRYPGEKLLNAGASVNAVDNDGRTALMYAVMGDDANGELAPLLLEAGADKRTRDRSGHTAVDYAEAGLSRINSRDRDDLLKQLR